MDDDGVQKMEVNRSTQSIWRVVRQAIAAGAFRSTKHQVMAPPFGISPSRSRWRILKHVILATLRLQSRWRSLPNLRDLKLKSIIGADDGSGKVYTAFHRQTGQDYALKELHYNSSQRQQISREVNFLKELDHPNLVKCYGVFFTAAADDYDDADSGLGCLLLEPLERGSPRVTDESDLVYIVRQLLLGLTYLHHRGIPHGDIKPSNVFVNHTGQVKLLYAGKILSPSESGSSHDGFSWDIWCVGLWILKFSENMRKPSEELLRFISACMHTDLLKRWTAEQLVNHPLFYQLPPGQKEAQLPLPLILRGSEIPPSKKEVQLPPWLEKWKKEVQLPTIKKEFQTPQLKKEKGVFHEREELMSPVNKKPKILMEDDDYGDGLKDMESLKDPTKGVLHVVPERCIEHCQLFLPDCEFEKDKLVRMWIAEECIEVGMTKRMEDVGNLYFDALVQEEVILPSKFDNLHKQMKYKFNMSQVSGGILKEGKYLGISANNVDEIYKEVLHITWHCTKIDRTFSDALKNLKQLHTLVVHEDQCTSISQLPNDIFLGLRLLRTLDISRTHISEVPGSIGKLESLQYLDISETPVKRLPESLDRLYCLQTLNLKACGGISALPRGFGRLVNLRHLDLDIVSQLKFMPRGMGNLIELQTLRAFIVGKNDGLGIGELKNMNEITGSFCISRLENVSDAEEAKEAALWNKRYVDKLELRWHNLGNDNVQDTSQILESLQPHFGLKELQLTCYGGSKLPGWISNPAYSDLTRITLYKCINCDILPSIGDLPSLKILHIVNMDNVSNIDALFCRNHEKYHETKVVNAFPMLEKLTLDSMPVLEEWTGIEDGDFPCLRHVSIKYCPKLRVLPSLSHLSSLEHFEIHDCMQLISLPEGSLPQSLESLIIRGCPGINEWCRKDGGLGWSKIASVRNIWIDLEKISLD